jgi:hypothetical protein
MLKWSCSPTHVNLLSCSPANIVVTPKVSHHTLHSPQCMVGSTNLPQNQSPYLLKKWSKFGNYY